MTGHLMDTAALGNDIKQASFESMIKAWKEFDEICDLEHPDQVSWVSDRILGAIDSGIRSLCVLYSANAQTEPETSLLNHLIISRHPCFRTCNPNFITYYSFWKEHPEKIIHKKKFSSEFKSFLKEVETVLQSIESYNFQLRREIYFTKEEHTTLKLKRKHLFIALGGIILLIAILYPLYKILDPILVYETTGQFFWQPDPTTPENENNSIWFKVKADGEFHEYHLKLIEPAANLVTLRMDPIVEQGAWIWIDFIEIWQKNNSHPIIYSFNKDTNGWVSNNHTDQLELDNGNLLFVATGNDPSIKIHDIEIENMSVIRIRMKVVLKSTFIQFIFSYLLPNDGNWRKKF